MPPAITYGTLATACPAIQVPSALINPLAPAAIPKVMPSFVVGMDPAAFVPRLQQAMLTVEGIGQRGAGLYGVVTGLDFADGGGLTLRVNDGAAMLDAYVAQVTTLGYITKALADGTPHRNYIWLGQAAQVTVTSTTLPPAGTWAYLGCAVVNSGAISSFDMSGVVHLPLGGWPERTTSDSGIPLDTPPAGVRFISHSNGDASAWLWNGSAYRIFGATAFFNFGHIGNVPNGATVYLPPGSGGASVNEYKLRVPVNATAAGLSVRARVAPGGALTDTYTVRKNGANTVLTCSMTGAATFAADTLHRVTFVRGDDISLQAVTGSPSAAADVFATILMY